MRGCCTQLCLFWCYWDVLLWGILLFGGCSNITFLSTLSILYYDFLPYFDPYFYIMALEKVSNNYSTLTIFYVRQVKEYYTTCPGLMDWNTKTLSSSRTIMAWCLIGSSSNPSSVAPNSLSQQCSILTIYMTVVKWRNLCYFWVNSVVPSLPKA